MFLARLTARIAPAFLTIIACTALTFAATQALKVTYYDFHEDGSNPEFQINFDKVTGIQGGTVNGKLVDSVLDASRKPTKRATTTPGYSINYISKWFRPYVPGDTVQIYKPADTILTVRDSIYICDSSLFLALGGDDPSLIMCNWTKRYDSTFTTAGIVTCDTCFKNVVLQDSVTFTELTQMWNGVSKNLLAYGSSSFFPLDGKGFEALGFPRSTGLEPHNFSFTMEMHYQFVYHGGEVLYFAGDDDIWGFINNKLALDIGGLHASLSDSIYLDSLKPAMTVGQTYNFDLFFCERHGMGSNFFMKTDIDFTTQIPVGVRPQFVNNSVDGRQIRLSNGSMVTIPHGTSELQYSLLNALGKIIASGQSSVVAFNGTAALDKMASGVYVMKITSLDKNSKVLGTVYGKIVK